MVVLVRGTHSCWWVFCRGNSKTPPPLARFFSPPPDRIPPIPFRAVSFPADDLAADYDGCAAGLHDKQVRLCLVQFRLADTGLTPTFQEKVISPVAQRLARKPIFDPLMQSLLVGSEFFRRPILFAPPPCPNCH